ncbi:hypothetical protein J2X77_004275 [Sphingobacterium sp. 2149]|nr:hypothetical protein [Sphingobacterium sp. 2149]
MKGFLRITGFELKLRAKVGTISLLLLTPYMEHDSSKTWKVCAKKTAFSIKSMESFYFRHHTYE